jgi:hypothetical protein
MSFRLISVFALGLACLALSACPKQAANGDQAAGQTQAAQQEQSPAGEVAPRPNPLSTVARLVDAMNSGDRGAFELLIHPDAPAREELLGKFEEFDRDSCRIELQDASIRSEEDTAATVIYDTQVNFNDGETRPDFETGQFKLQFEGGAWLIWDVS